MCRAAQRYEQVKSFFVTSGKGDDEARWPPPPFPVNARREVRAGAAVLVCGFPGRAPAAL